MTRIGGWPLLRWVLLLAMIGPSVVNDCEAQPGDYPFLGFVRAEAKKLRGGDQPSGSLEEWNSARSALRVRLLEAWGGFPERPCDLQPRLIETIPRDGYRIEKLIFQTLPDVWMTANAYVPDLPGPLPAVLCVHGHWREAKTSPHIQSRSIGLAKLGFFVLAVDALGAGERGLSPAGNEYHGEMVAATLLPVGKPLSGLQVYENQRAVDYLLTRSEVDPARIGITGASGGGNQTMYAGAWEERFQAVVPVCSVGNYQAYLGAACCMCEVVPGALQFTEEGNILGLVAPRGLMVISATDDSHQFSPGEARQSILAAAPLFGMYQASRSSPVHTVIKSPHEYNQKMREAMYGFMTLHLKQQGNGEPIPEPAHETLEPERLRCFPGNTRPENWLTIPQLAAREGRVLLAGHESLKSRNAWGPGIAARRAALDRKSLGGTAPRQPRVLQRTLEETCLERIAFEPEPGIQLEMTRRPAKTVPKPAVVLLLNLEPEWPEQLGELEQALRAAGGEVVVLSLRATGSRQYPRDRVGRAPDHNTAEWSLWLGRPLLGQWVLDVRASLDLLEEIHGKSTPFAVLGHGSAGLIALCAGALDERVAHVATWNSLASYVTELPYEQQRLGTLAPGIVRDVGDVPQLVTLLGGRKGTIVGGVDGQGRPLSREQLQAAYAFASRQSDASLLQITAVLPVDELARRLLVP
ncbi:MAG: alpha/beta hydrolase family protein [Planctomycetaceae bacterium]|nr:acetylxylan esterase [Planctomycetaceae bacterium]